MPKTKKTIFLAFMVLFFLTISFIVVILSVPYIFHNIASKFLSLPEFGILFILSFWAIFVVTMWIYKLILYFFVWDKNDK